MITKSSEEYLKVMYVLLKQKGEIRVTDIAEKMNCSKPNVTKQLNILSKNKYIEYKSYGHITFTDKGYDLARKVLADYDILYILLHDVIGVENEIAACDASKIKGIISEEALSKISSYICDTLDLKNMNCNFNIRNEKCRMCISKKGKLV